MAASSPARGRVPTAPETQRADPRRRQNSKRLTVDLHELAMLVARRAAGVQRAHQLAPAAARGRRIQWGDAAKVLHLLGQWGVYTLVGLHVGATVWHVAIRRDGLLDRMIPPQDQSGAFR